MFDPNRIRMGKGWDKAAGKSRNAVYAEEEGLRVKSKITAAWLREAGVTETVAFVKKLIDWGRVARSERHHTSAAKNWVNYYDAAEIAEQLADLERGGYLEVLRAMAAEEAWRDAGQWAVMAEMIRRRR